ncbi:histidinol-phosphate transaminase [Arenimonas composti]|uniref:Histidinol-phosphate aminotransferase n=1 Tax=Arenimonas composti TR7-09 = DSM 18010 TaxID=1121013 RepID=A0A091BBS5_9GAMM|nr:histidinol-phosphate transaminase [Arenimonas composti]KFN48927.1 hypothetical protein P873_01105 [Arenimonas composti TR7-09 = DSM 18010]
MSAQAFATSTMTLPPALQPLVRPDLAGFAGYASAARERGAGSVRLDANESPHANAADRGGRLRRYPPPQPQALREALADLYGSRPENLLLCRGSDEAIDLLVRGCCRAGLDPVLVTPPTFGMYAVAARLQGAPLQTFAQQAGGAGFALDFAALEARARDTGARVLFLCSPGNPTGQALDPDAVLALAQALQGRCLVVLDEAYVEFADVRSLAPSAGTPTNLCVLRTLSKAHALAGARIGALVAAPELVAWLARLQAPYPLPVPSVAAALAALAPAARAATRTRIAAVVAQRERMAKALVRSPRVRAVLPSQANFLAVRFVDADDALARLAAAGIIVRDQRAQPGLADVLRISIGSARENAALLEALA